jgi:glycosyltransferase involved in cell wall biosynthesis
MSALLGADIRDGRTVVIGTAPHNFAGAGAIHARVSALLAEMGLDVRFVASCRPFYHDDMARAGVTIIVSATSSAPSSQDAVEPFGIAREIVRQASLAARDGRKVVLLGSYLFPFFDTVHRAAILLERQGVPFTCIAVPAGSDIWQIGVKHPELTRHLLTHRLTHARLTYARQFAHEITEWFGECGPIHVIPPPVDTRSFRPATAREQQALRTECGIRENARVLLNCSNMRPVKGIGLTLDLAQQVAARSDGEVVLLLLGPLTEPIRDSLSLPDGTTTPVTVREGSLMIRVEGVQADTRPYHAMADIAINTSYHDSFNVSLAESMACGTPIVSSDVVGLGEILRKDDECAHLFPLYRDTGCDKGVTEVAPEARERAVEAVLRLCSDSVFRTRCGVNARAVVQRELAGEIIGTRWIQFLEDALSRSTETGARRT